MSDDSGDAGLGLSDLLSIGSYNLVCVVAGMGLGWWADAAAGTTPVLTLGGLAAGIVAGVLGTWLRVRPLLSDGAGDDPGRPGDAEGRGRN